MYYIYIFMNSHCYVHKIQLVCDVNNQLKYIAIQEKVKASNDHRLMMQRNGD